MPGQLPVSGHKQYPWVVNCPQENQHNPNWLISLGLPINVDYELIKKFIDSNQNYFTKPSPDDLSNKEIKQINGVIGEILQSNNLSYRPKD